MYYFDKLELQDFNIANTKNFAMANGLGGFCSCSIINSTYRKQFGYLVASLNSPAERFLILTKINEEVSIEGKTYSLDTQKYKDRIATGNKYLEEFSYNFVPTFLYSVKGVDIKKRIAPNYGFNTVAVTYEIFAKKDCEISFEPLFNYREQGDASKPEDLLFEESFKDGIYTLVPQKNNKVKIKFMFDNGSLYNNDDKITEGFVNDYDIQTGDPRLDYHYKPIKIKLNLKANQVKEISFITTIERITQKDAISMIIDYDDRISSLIKRAKLSDNFAKNLVWSSDSFIAKRNSTNLKTILAGLPWFLDWGRDAMIAFTGLTLVTKRFKEAKEILKSFAMYEKNGLISNMFPDFKDPPIYNTADASLWYVYACYKYATYTSDYDFIKDDIYPTLKNIIHYYMVGTSNSIYMDKDYLIHAGSDLDQVTWMDVRVGNHVVTPRHGKPVEINALWYNALKIMSIFASKFNDSDPYSTLANHVYQNFRLKFFNNGYLYDVVDPNDAKIRPNALYAASLPFKLLTKEEAKKMLQVATTFLYNEFGMRSLSPNDKDYIATYDGPLELRDEAYHNGTTWAYLIGAYFDVFNYAEPNKKDELKHMFLKFNRHLEEGCINGVAEVFNGSDCAQTKGCYNQAWSVGELLRSYYENVLKENENE